MFTTLKKAAFERAPRGCIVRVSDAREPTLAGPVAAPTATASTNTIPGAERFSRIDPPPSPTLTPTAGPGKCGCAAADVLHVAGLPQDDSILGCDRRGGGRAG